MEVVSCKSCKEVVSEQAESCPHCGNSQFKDGSKSKVQKVIFLLAAVVAAAVLFKVGLMPMF